MAALVKFPTEGCIVEYLEDNAVQIAMVLEASNGKYRLLLPSRRETKLAQNRILPWAGPACAPGQSREECIRQLEARKSSREKLTADISILDLWELAEGEIEQADVAFFAGLVETDPDADTIAAYGRALLGCKTHFRFQPPHFIVHPRDVVEKRLAEQKSKEEKEAFVAGGAAFLRYLWDVASKKKSLPLPDDISIDDRMSERIEKLLFARMRNPDSQEDDSLWHLLGKGLPDVPHLPYQLLVAWGKLPRHYNFWLDRADYDAGNSWWLPMREEVEKLALLGRGPEKLSALPDNLDFISIDGEKTRDIDDAFHISKDEQGWELTVALACPALAWPFGEPLDKQVMRRGTSIYLPEGDLHMLPEMLGTDGFSLLADQARPAFCLRMKMDSRGEPVLVEPILASARLAANLNYGDVQQIISANGAKEPLPQNGAAAFADQLLAAHELALVREQLRIGQGAVVMRRHDQKIVLNEQDGEVVVELRQEEDQTDAQRLVAEMMVLASAAFADWATQRDIPLIYRTQNVAIPREYAGIWQKPEELARVMRALAPSMLETASKPHAALAVPRYAPVTSPLRRYADMLNEAQALSYLAGGRPRWSRPEMDSLLESLSISLEAAGQVQRFRPRYWKLLYFRQQGDKVWWDGIITEENENFITVNLPAAGIFVRGRRNMFEDRATPGMSVRLRLGRVNPLYNEIHILEVIPAE